MKILSKKRYWLFVLLLFIPFFFLISNLFSYDTEYGHPYFTERAAVLFNKYSENKLSVQEIEWLKEGAIDEDVPPRWMNHFYDPKDL